MKLAALKKLPINNINYGEVLSLNKNILENIIFLNFQVPLVYETRYLILLVKTNKNNFFVYYYPMAGILCSLTPTSISLSRLSKVNDNAITSFSESTPFLNSDLLCSNSMSTYNNSIRPCSA